MERGYDVVGVSVAVRNSEGLFLILKRAQDKKHSPGKWEFPSGVIDGEEKPLEAAKREIQEEIGFKPESLKENGEYKINKDSRSLKAYFFVAEIQNTNIDLSREHTDYNWVGYSQIPNYETSERINHELKLINRQN